ncbi:MAG: hypothetical protein NXI10_06390 [bacterium]|nr:hypothetical protein [bacterium]
MTSNLNMTPNEREIERTFEAGDRISRVPASDALMERLKQIPETVRAGYAKVPKKVVWAAAASIAILIVLNILSARDYTQETNASKASSSYFDHLKTL